jgi:hypothetical protein
LSLAPNRHDIRIAPPFDAAIYTPNLSGMRKPILLALLLAGGCTDMCGNEVIGSAEAPDHAHVAYLFQRDCGATTDFSTQVSILPKGRKLSGSGNAYTGDADHGAAGRDAWGGPRTEMEWLSARHLRIRYAAGSRIFRQEQWVSGVQISYQAMAG